MKSMILAVIEMKLNHLLNSKMLRNLNLNLWCMDQMSMQNHRKIQICGLDSSMNLCYNQAHIVMIDMNCLHTVVSLLNYHSGHSSKAQLQNNRDKPHLFHIDFQNHCPNDIHQNQSYLNHIQLGYFAQFH